MARIEMLFGGAIFPIAAAAILVMAAMIVLSAWSAYRWPGRNWRMLSQVAPTNLGCPGEKVWNLFFDHILFFDQQHGLALAHTHRPYDARVFRTRDGGIHWQPETILGSGPVGPVNAFPDGTIVLLQRCWAKDREWWYVLRISKDYGVTWNINIEMAKADGIGFMDDQRGFIWRSFVEDNDEGQPEPAELKYTLDSGATWETVDLPPDTYLLGRCGAHPDGSFIYLYKADVVRLTRVGRGAWTEEKHALPCSTGGEGLYIDRENVWLVTCPSDEFGGSIFRLKSSGDFEPFGQFPTGFNLDAISYHSSLVTVVGGEAFCDKPPAPRMEILRTYDTGKSWQSETAGLGRGVPVALFRSHIWAVARDNRVYYRN